MNIPARIIKDDVSIVLCGEAGQGIQTVERILTRVFKFAGFNVFATKEYMSRVRGGSNSTEIRVSSQRRDAYVDRIDFLIPLDKDAIPHLGDRVTDETVILGDRERLGIDRKMIDVPFVKIAAEVGGPIYANTVAVGIILGMFNVDIEVLNNYLDHFFAAKSADIIQKNHEAGKRGHELGRSFAGPGKIEINVQRHPEVKDDVIFSGADAVALGAIGGGCDFIAAYPMTPSTGILTYIAQHAAEFGMIAEQAEDEISAINMAIGAWYAGGRGMVATAGGGFALMVEGLSLAGMIESPLVVSVGQRPAPATGLPTRTEQADLNHVLYSGHGEFPRAVLAPATLEDAFTLTAGAFSTADRFQVPVIVLSDQYLVDTYYNVPLPDTAGLTVQKNITKTAPDYRRFSFTENGLSPRGVPGYGDGLVAVDSDEHDEEGHITESGEVRTRMVEKRLRKQALVEKEIVPPELYGNPEYRTLVVGWGSTYGVIREALESSGRDDIAMLHFRQVYPLHSSTVDYMKKAKTTVIVENNATAQFGNLIHCITGMAFDKKILKYNGMPFSVEELRQAFMALPKPSSRKPRRTKVIAQ
jgi:2-oxoglutarate/2-oxoacid ferredoxin oxidoreductase subunit alpha